MPNMLPTNMWYENYKKNCMSTSLGHHTSYVRGNTTARHVSRAGLPSRHHILKGEEKSRRHQRSHCVRTWLSAERRLRFGQPWSPHIWGAWKIKLTSSTFWGCLRRCSMNCLPELGRESRSRTPVTEKSLEPGLKLTITIKRLASGYSRSELCFIGSTHTVYHACFMIVKACCSVLCKLMN